MKQLTKYISKILIIFFVGLILIGLSAPRSFADEDQELFLVAQKAFEDGFYDVAIRYIDQILEQYPQTDKRIQANLLLGQCYFFKSQYLKAYDVFEELLQYSEYKDATLFWLGETYLKGSDFKRAEQQYIKLIELYKHSIYAPQAYYSLGWVYFEQGQFEDAKRMFLTLLGKYPDHQLTEDAVYKIGESEYNLKDYQNTIDFFTNYMEKYPRSNRHGEANFYIAESYYYLDDPLTAITFYAKAAEMSFDNKLVLMAKVSLGWSYLKLEKYKLSEKYFQEAESLSFEKGILSDDVFFGQASLFAQTEEYDKAVVAYKQLLKNFPKSPRKVEALLGLANIFYAQENYKEAITHYKNIISTNKQEGLEDIIDKAYFGLAWSYLKKGDIDKSIETFSEVKETSKNKTVKISAIAQIGDAYQDIDEYEKAIEVYDDILQDNPDSPYTDYVQYRQGIALLKLNKIEAATLSFQSLQANFPESKYLDDVKYYLAVAYFQQGDWTTSQQQIENFINSTPDYNEFLEDAHYILALSSYNLDLYARAIKESQKLIKIASEGSKTIENAEVIIAKSNYKTGKVKEALLKFEQIIANYPQSDAAQESFIWIGDHYLETSQYDAAINDYLKFLKQFPGTERKNVVYFEIGQAYQAKGDLENALMFFKKIKDPKDSELLAKSKLAIAAIFTKKLDPASSIETYESIIESSPEFQKDTYAKIAETYKELQDYTKAITSYSQALKAAKGSSKITDPEIQFNIGDTYEFLNDSKKAIEQYLKIPYLYPQNTIWIIKSYLRMARIFEDDEEWKDAILTYRKIIEMETDEADFAKERIFWIKDNFQENN